MKATTTLGNLIDQVETMSAGNFDETVSLSEIEFGSLNEMWIGGVGVELLPQAQRLLANRLRTPFSYLDRCPAELQAENLNYWLEQERKERNTFFCRFNGQRQVRAVFLHALGHLRPPAFREFLHCTHIQMAVMEIRFQLWHMPPQKAAILTDTVAAHG